MPLQRSFVMSVLLLALTAFLSGCSSSPLTPTRPTMSTELDAATSDAPLERTHARRGFYPLEPGNRWHYQRRFSVRVVGFDGEEIDRHEFLSEIESEQACVETINEREYLVERRIETSPGQIFRTWIRFRQDRRGLYEADVSIVSAACVDGPTGSAVATPSIEDAVWNRVMASMSDPDRRAGFTRAWLDIRERMATLQRSGVGTSTLRHRGERGGWRRGPAFPPDGELLRLSYPLVPRRHWVIRDEPRFAARVERGEVLDLEPGRMFSWRIRLTNEFLGDEDFAHVWYGRQGFLKLAAHFESDATDQSGQHIGTVISEEHQVLDDLDLVGGGRFARAVLGVEALMAAEQAP